MSMQKGHKASVDYVTTNFGTIWPAYIDALGDLLVVLRRELDGDLDLVLILAVLAGRTRPEGWRTELSGYRALRRAIVRGTETELTHPINVQSLAEYTGVPRETVRRKIAQLEERGWIVREENGSLAFTEKIGADLERATEQSIEFLAALHSAFDTPPRGPGQRSGD